MGRRLGWALLLLLGLHAAAAQAGQRVVGVRHHTDDRRTRVVLDLAEPVSSYQVRRVRSPERIVIDVEGASLAPRGAETTPGAAVEKIRFNALPNRAQVVLDLDRAHRFEFFTLGASSDRPPRIVVDVFEPLLPSNARRLPPQLDPPHRGEPYVVVIDPGHGGRDRGTAGCGIALEKEVVLGIAHEMAAFLERSQGFKVVLTRPTDRTVDLSERVAIAQRAEGDLFVSIHANSAPSRTARGAEVYFLSPRGATDQAAAELANRENAALLVGVDSSQAQDDDLVSILMDLKGSAILQRSSHLAEMALDELGALDGGSARAVKQARFAVLRTLSMPAVLVEAGFLSHRGEAKWLGSERGQRAVGEALARAVGEYCRRFGEKGVAVELAANRTHTVRRGDTLWELARAYDTSVQALTTANHLTTSVLRVGQQLVVP